MKLLCTWVDPNWSDLLKRLTLWRVYEVTHQGEFHNRPAYYIVDDSGTTMLIENHRTDETVKVASNYENRVYWAYFVEVPSDA